MAARRFPPPWSGFSDTVSDSHHIQVCDGEIEDCRWVGDRRFANGGWGTDRAPNGCACFRDRRIITGTDGAKKRPRQEIGAEVLPKLIGRA
jgi:hypothetical protein